MTSGDGPVSHKTDSPAADICQLETRPDGHGHGHAHSGLGQAQNIYQPSVNPNRHILANSKQSLPW